MGQLRWWNDVADGTENFCAAYDVGVWDEYCDVAMRASPTDFPAYSYTCYSDTV